MPTDTPDDPTRESAAAVRCMTCGGDLTAMDGVFYCEKCGSTYAAPVTAAHPVLTDKQREQLRAWHESLGCRCIASIETVPCCIDYL